MRETKDATAHKLVARPVLTPNKISLLIIVSECLKPVRDLWSKKHKLAAMITSAEVDNALMDIVRPEIPRSCW